MNDSIQLSPEHGLNPTIPVCFFCGESKNEIALMGRIHSKKGARDDVKAPMYMVLNYEPCDECIEKFKQGVLLIEVTTVPQSKNQPPISNKQEELFPTGAWCIVSEEAEFCKENNLTAGSSVFISKELFKSLFGGSDEET